MEPSTAACLTASLAAGRPTAVSTPGTSMAGLDCAEVSIAAWPTLKRRDPRHDHDPDAEADAAMRELAADGLAIGDCGAATLRGAAARRSCPGRTLLIATEGVTDPASYAATAGP